MGLHTSDWRQIQAPNMVWSNTYFGDRSCKHYNLVELANALHELIDARSFDDIYIMVLALNLYRYRKIGLIQYLRTLEYVKLRR